MKNWFEVGDIITFSSGSYEEYCTCGTYKVCSDFEYNSLVKHWAKHTDRKLKKNYYDNPYYNDGYQDGFVKHLVAHGFIKYVETKGVHLGDTGEVEIDEDEI